MILNNRKETYDKIKKRPDNRTDTHSIRPEGSAGRTRSFETQAQEPARLRLWDGAAAARAGRPVGRRAGMQHQLAAGAKLRDLHAAVPGPDGRRASGVRARRKGARVSQEEVQGSGLINRGLRAPSPYKEASFKLQATSDKLQAAGPLVRTKPQAASDKLQAPSRKQQAPGQRLPHKVSGIVARGS